MRIKKLLVLLLIFMGISCFLGQNYLGNVLENYIISNIDQIALENEHILTVGKGKQFSEIQKAVDYADDGYVIIVYPGEYNEAVDATNKTLSIIGVDKESCILKHPNGDYHTPPLEIGSGKLVNMTVYAISEEKKENAVAKSYAIHIDYDISKQNTLYVKNVNIINDDYQGIGIGLRDHSVIEFHECNFIVHDDYNAFYCHDDPINANAVKQKLIVENCFFENNGNASTILLQSQEEEASDILCKWRNNVVNNKSSDNLIDIYLWKAKEIENAGWLGMSFWKNSVFSKNNNIEALNY